MEKKEKEVRYKSNITDTRDTNDASNGHFRGEMWNSLLLLCWDMCTSLSLSLCLPPPLSLSLSLSLTNQHVWQASHVFNELLNSIPVDDTQNTATAHWCCLCNPLQLAHVHRVPVVKTKVRVAVGHDRFIVVRGAGVWWGEDQMIHRRRCFSSVNLVGEVSNGLAVGFSLVVAYFVL